MSSITKIVDRKSDVIKRKADSLFNEIITCVILPHISLAVTKLPSVRPKQGRTVTLTFWVSDAATAKVTGGFPLEVL